jgi:hypothetical protein
MMQDEHGQPEISIPQKVAMISKSVSLTDIVVSKAEYSSTKSGTVAPGKAQITASVKSVVLEPELTVLLEFRASAKAKDSRKNLVSLKALFKASYQLDEGFEADVEGMQYFSEVNSVLNVWPYWRAFVSEAFLKMRINPPLIIPVFRAREFRNYVKPTADAVVDEIRSQIE